jgi:hypothetical protein
MTSSAHDVRWIRQEAAMIAMQLTNAGLARRQEPGRSSEFQPLDPGVVNAAIPAFFIGRNMEGFWVARDLNGRIGGIFLLETSAVSFARHNSRPAGCATIYPSERFELDLENNGNPLVAQLGSLMRLIRRPRRRTAALIGKMAETVKRRLGVFAAPGRDRT